MTEPRRVLITGSQTWPDEAEVKRVLDEAWAFTGPFVLVHGAARGVDQMAEIHQAARFRPTEAHPAEWDRYGKRAGYVRNAKMVALGADICLAFIHNESRGATMCANLAEEAGIPARRYVLTTNGDPR
jgi:hypothetical protein